VGAAAAAAAAEHLGKLQEAGIALQQQQQLDFALLAAAAQGSCAGNCHNSICSSCSSS
jgi:hypothetical protein